MKLTVDVELDPTDVVDWWFARNAIIIFLKYLYPVRVVYFRERPSDDLKTKIALHLLRFVIGTNVI